MKKFFFILFLCGTAAAAFAQSDSRLMVFLHGGYGILPNKTSGLTSSSPDYIDQLSSGIDWNVQAYFRNKMFITGLLYSAYTAKGKQESGNGSDKITTAYVGPQVGVNIPIGKIDIVFNGGIGGMWYRNNAIVYEKDRKVKGNSLGANLGLKGVYNFTPHLGISLEASYIGSSLYGFNAAYHDEIYRVRYEDPISLGQLTFSLGLKCSL